VVAPVSARRYNALLIALLKLGIILLFAAALISAFFNLLNYLTAYQTESRFKQIELAVYLYQSRYDRLPGDDDLRPARGEQWTYAGGRPIPGGNRDGLISFSTDDASESALVWPHLRAAGLISGNVADSRAPRILPGIEFVAFSGTLFGGSGTFICAHNISTQVLAHLMGNTSTINARNTQLLLVNRRNYPAAAMAAENGHIVCYRVAWVV
jgi:hypothetical protein